LRNKAAGRDVFCWFRPELGGLAAPVLMIFQSTA